MRRAVKKGEGESEVGPLRVNRTRDGRASAAERQGRGMAWGFGVILQAHTWAVMQGLSGSGWGRGMPVETVNNGALGREEEGCRLGPGWDRPQ